MDQDHHKISKYTFLQYSKFNRMENDVYHAYYFWLEEATIRHCDKKVEMVIVNNFTNINKVNMNLWPQTIEETKTTKS